MNRDHILKEIKSDIKILLIGAVIAVTINHTLIVSATVPTGSMDSTIQPGSRIIGSRLSYIAGDPKRGDIITFHCPDKPDEVFLKRVIGLPGEVIEGSGGGVYVDGNVLEEDYIKEVSYDDFGPYTIPSDSYFVMGDNRNNSWDSRYWNHKFVGREAITGKAKLEYYPDVKIFP